MAQKSCLDEADKMLFRDFTEQIYDIFQLLPSPPRSISCPPP
jgi:superfamily II DNA/RNA helicase